MRILVIEDEKDIADFIKKALIEESYAVDIAFDGLTGEEFAFVDSYDLIILDLMLPQKEGIPVLKSFRQDGIQTPVLILTVRSEVPDRVSGLDAGADDYLVKPFAVAELRARVRALLRRNSTDKQVMLTIDELTLDRSLY